MWDIFIGERVGDTGFNNIVGEGVLLLLLRPLEYDPALDFLPDFAAVDLADFLTSLLFFITILPRILRRELAAVLLPLLGVDWLAFGWFSLSTADVNLYWLGSREPVS